MTPVQHPADSGKLSLLDWLWTRQKTSTENQVLILSKCLGWVRSGQVRSGYVRSG